LSGDRSASVNGADESAHAAGPAGANNADDDIHAPPGGQLAT